MPDNKNHAELQVHRLGGLDGQNPLGFFAALGALRVLDDVARRDGSAAPKLAFLDEGRVVAQLSCHLSFEAVVDALLEDAQGELGAAALALAYDDEGMRCGVDAPKAKRDLKPAPATARAYLQEMQQAERRSADLAQAFMSELVQDNNGNTKPTSFHFAAGQQQWLDMVDGLRKATSREYISEGLLGPWKEHAAPSLAWDSSVARNYALRANDPSTDKRGSIPAANWLAVVGLTFFPVARQRGKLRTSRVVGGWKDSTFLWPVWSTPITVSIAAALLRGDPLELSREQRSVLGVTQVFASNILRTDQGGYGSFAPADVRGPRRAKS